MWYLKTKLGMFWIAPVLEEKSKYYLGINNEALGTYQDVEQAAKDVHDQATGYFKWDSEARVKVPLHVKDWVEGQPEDWE